MEIRSVGPFLDYWKSVRGCTKRVISIEVVAFMNRLDEESVAIFERLSDDQLTDKCVTPAGTSITAWKWLRAMVEHEAHHRGKIYMMLAVIGVQTPPLYGLTAEQVQASSARN